MTATSRPLRSIDHRADLNKLPADSSPCIIDFFAGRDRLLAETDQATIQFEIEQPVRTATARSERPDELFDPLEDWLYSLTSAAALILQSIYPNNHGSYSLSLHQSRAPSALNHRSSSTLQL